MRLERSIEIIEKAIPFDQRGKYVHVKIDVAEDGTVIYSKKLITPKEFKKLLEEHKWLQSTRKLLGSRWDYMIRQCDDEY